VTKPSDVSVSEKLLLSVTEACAVAGLPRSRLYLDINSGKLFSVKVGKSRRIPSQSLRDYVQRIMSEQAGG